jgi:hypothetical protein
MANNARNKVFKRKAVYYCQGCDSDYYTGASDKNYAKLKDTTYPDLKRCKESEFHIDHIDPVVPIGRTLHDMTLDEIAMRVYCSEDNLAYICSFCHIKKTSREKTKRTSCKKEKKSE